MSTVQEFQQSLLELDTGSTVVEPDQSKTTLNRAVDPLGIGAPLPFDEVFLPETVLTPNPLSSQLRNGVTGVTGFRFGIASLGPSLSSSDQGATNSSRRIRSDTLPCSGNRILRQT